MSKAQNTDAQKSKLLQGTLDLMVEWGASEHNRKAKYYSITKSGRKQIERETENWARIAGVIGRLLKLEGQE
jgi:DNA-binding PadR family transcriptional regulator